MKYGLINTEKLYFSSKEAAEIVGISVKDLHKLELKYPELNPKINANGKRIYKQSDIEIAKKIKNNIVQKAKPKKIKPSETATTSTTTIPKNPDLLLQVRNRLQNTLNNLRNK